MRFLKGEGVDLLFLARNCRTSIEMIDRFYARHLSAVMAPEKIVGLKSVKKTRGVKKSATKKKPTNKKAFADKSKRKRVVKKIVEGATVAEMTIRSVTRG